MPQETYEIVLDRPDDVTVREMNKYIKEAVTSWGGQFHPDDPLFTANWGGIKSVKRLTPASARKAAERLNA